MVIHQVCSMLCGQQPASPIVRSLGPVGSSADHPSVHTWGSYCPWCPCCLRSYHRLCRPVAPWLECTGRSPVQTDPTDVATTADVPNRKLPMWQMASDQFRQCTGCSAWCVPPPILHWGWTSDKACTSRALLCPDQVSQSSGIGPSPTLRKPRSLCWTSTAWRICTQWWVPSSMASTSWCSNGPAPVQVWTNEPGCSKVWTPIWHQSHCKELPTTVPKAETRRAIFVSRHQAYMAMWTIPLW